VDASGSTSLRGASRGAALPARRRRLAAELSLLPPPPVAAAGAGAGEGERGDSALPRLFLLLLLEGDEALLAPAFAQRFSRYLSLMKSLALPVSSGEGSANCFSSQEAR